MKQSIHKRNVGIWKCMNVKCKQKIPRVHGAKVIVVKDYWIQNFNVIVNENWRRPNKYSERFDK